MSLLPVAGAICLLAAVIEGWVLALIHYLKWEPVKKIFPGYRYLVRSHIDYAMMATLVFVTYLILKNLGLALPKLAIVALIVGAFGNPFGFFLQAIKPELLETDSLLLKVGILLGLLPATYGIGTACILVISKAASL